MGNGRNQAAGISFPGVSDAEADKLAASLVPALNGLDRSISIKRMNTNHEAQNPGAELAIVLGTSAITALARGIATWLAHNSGTNIEIHAPDGTSVIVKHASGRDTAQTVQAALRGRR